MSLVFNWLDLTNYPSLAVNGPSSTADAWRNQHRAILKNSSLYVFTDATNSGGRSPAVYSSTDGSSWALIDTTCPQVAVYNYVILKNPGSVLELLSSAGSASSLKYSDFSGSAWDGSFFITDSVSGNGARQHHTFGGSKLRFCCSP